MVHCFFCGINIVHDQSATKKSSNKSLFLTVNDTGTVFFLDYQRVKDLGHLFFVETYRLEEKKMQLARQMLGGS